MIIIDSSVKLKVNDVITGRLTNLNGDWNTVTFKVLSEATQEDYINFVKEMLPDYNFINPFCGNFYKIHTD